jgi:hypothetical protein
MSFRFPLPDAPIAAASADIGHVAVALALTLAGDVQVVSSSLEDARPVLDRISEGVFVSGLDTGAPNVTSTARHRFTQAGTKFVAPSTMVFTGGSVIDYAQDGVEITGEVGYSLAVTVEPHNRAPEDHADGDAWFTRNGGTLASIGAIVLIGRSLA